MDTQPKLPPDQIKQLRARWFSPSGQAVLNRLIAIWQGDSRGWRSLVDDLPEVSVPAPHPGLLTDLRGLELKAVRLNGAQMPYVDLSYASFKNCNLQEICLQGSKLSWASFEHCNLKRSDLLQVVADNSRFLHCFMNHAVLDVSDLRWASFQDTEMPMTILDGADLTHAVLKGGSLAGSSARETRLPSGFDRKRLNKHHRSLGNDPSSK
ncbi:pentapeptide repeat-containing protein [Pseudomonas viridiflava]|uniref:pentapeptide repeat-containing protein n=1 Tax=Pseudomonas viridiflava TaxID=33069 RepID=UPI000F03219F|nr:pentapeptide repeat-containing protein [Pseudomonas viridiflava]